MIPAMFSSSSPFLRRLRLWAMAVLALALAGCVGLQPRPDPTRFYVLTGETAARNQPGEIDLVVRRLALPDYLDSARLVVRASESEIRYRNHHRWGGGALDRMLAQSISNGLQDALPDWRVTTRSTMPPRWQLDVRVLRFEGGPGMSAHFAFDWEISATGDDGRRAAGRVSREGAWDGEDMAALVEVLAELVRESTSELAEAIKRLDQSPD